MAVLALGLVINQVPGAVAANEVQISGQPALYPAFQTNVTDYVVRCRAGVPVALTISVPAKMSVAVDGRPPQTGSFTADVAIGGSQGFSFSTQRAQSPADTYRVRCLPSDFPTWTAARTGKAQAGGYVLTPMGPGIGHYVAMFNPDGVPTWWMKPAFSPIDAKLLPSGHIAWAHYPGFGGFGSTPSVAYEIRTLGGLLVHEVRAVGSTTDFHELQTAANGNYLLLSYRPRDGVDLSAFGGPASATVMDAEIQEVAPTGALVWSWNSKDHIALSETGHWYVDQVFKYDVRLPDGRQVFDIVHANSVDAVGDSIILSARHLDAVYEISRETGKIRWKLGGTPRPESLGIAGDPNYGAASFGGQHDARLLHDGTLTLHDNGSGRGRPPRAVRFKIDLGTRTATLLEALTDPLVPASNCCGGSRRLRQGNWVTSWGGSPRITEMTPAGERVFDLTLGPFVSSYRAFPVPRTLDPAVFRAGMDALHPR